MSLTAQALLAQVALKTAQLQIGGLSVTVRELSLEARARMLGKDNTEAALLIVRECVLGDDGSPLLTEDEAKSMAKGSAKTIDTIVEKVMQLSGLRDEPGKD